MIRSVGLAACALCFAAPASASPACLQLNQLLRWGRVDHNVMLIEDKSHQKFKVAYRGYCGNLSFARSIDLRSASNSALGCVGRGDSIIVHLNGATYQCPIDSVSPAPAAMPH